MNLVELGPGQQARLPRVPLRVRVTSTSNTHAALQAIGGQGAAQRISDREVVVLPKPGQVQLSVSPAAGGSFRPGDLVGLSIRTEGGEPAHQVEIAQSSVEAMASARLGVLDLGAEVVLTSTGPQRAPEWLASGISALRRSGVPEADRATPAPWALVVDGSASMLSLQRTGQLADLLRLVCGVMYGWTNRLPDVALRTTPGTDLDLTPLLASPDPDLAELVAGAPAAWSRLAPCIARATRVAPIVVVLTDGVPVDVADLRARQRRTKGRLLMVTLGSSRFSATAGDEPDGGTALGTAHAPGWAEELAPLAAIDELPNGTVVALPVMESIDGPRVVLDDVSAAAVAGKLVVERALASSAEAGDGW